MWSAGRSFVAGALAVVLGCGPEAKRPNVLLITIDTLRADHLGAYGYARPTSPEIDAFAQRACVFEAAHSSSSWTLPSLSSIHTSLLSTTHGCWKIQSKLEPSFTTLAERLRDAGYDTSMVACHLFLSAQYGLQQGFTHVDDTLIRTAQDSDKAISSPGVTAKGLAWIEEKAAVKDGVPWFLWLHYFDPHDEYLPHTGFSEAFGTQEEIDLYDGEIAFTDHHVGRILRRLAALGLEEDTIVVITSDHGEEFGEHGHKRHGYTLYQEAIRIPLVVRAPGIAALRIPDVVSNVDLLPTLCDLARVPLGTPRGPRGEHPLEGRSLRALLEGGMLTPREAVSEVRWHEGQDMRALRAGAWKYMEDHSVKAPRDELYDLATDPFEKSDLLARDGARTRALGDQLLQRIARALRSSACYPLPEAYEPSPGDLERMKAMGYTGEDDATEPKPSVPAPPKPGDERTGAEARDRKR